jgi:molecular chaperone HtpG
VLASIQTGLTNRVLGDLEKLANGDSAKFYKIWENFGAVIKEGLYEDYAHRAALLGLARFKTTASDGAWRSLKDYADSLKENQTAIYYVVGNDLDRLASSPQLEGFKARGIEVLLLSDQIDNFWVTGGVDHEGKPFKSVTQGMSDLDLIPLPDGDKPQTETTPEVTDFMAFVKATLGEAVSDVRASNRLTESAVCLVASEHAMDRQLEKLLASAGQLPAVGKPVLEINSRHGLITRLSSLGSDDQALREDAAHLLFDEARIADGELPLDPRAFSARLGRILGQATRT